MSDVLGYTRAFGELQRIRQMDPWSDEHFEKQPGSGLYIPAHHNGRARPTAIDLFAGAGGFSLGFEQAGFDVVGALDNDYHAAITYLVNLGKPSTRIYIPDEKDRIGFKKVLNAEDKREVGKKVKPPQDVPWSKQRLEDHGEFFTWNGAGTSAYATKREDGLMQAGCEVMWIADAKKIHGQQILDSLGLERGNVDAVMGGPPCQGFSFGGKRNVYDERNSLVFDFIRIVCDIQPRTWVFENVPGIMSMVTADGELVMDAMVRMAEQGGMGHADQIRQMLETTAGAGMAHKGKTGNPQESRAERRTRVRDERKTLKKETKRAISKGKKGELYVQEELL